MNEETVDKDYFDLPKRVRKNLKRDDVKIDIVY